MCLISVADYENRAATLLTNSALGYYASGSRDQISLHNNRAAWEQIHLLPRVLVDVAKRSIATEVLDVPIAMPLIVAPTAMHKLAHPEGEVATAKGVG